METSEEDGMKLLKWVCVKSEGNLTHIVTYYLYTDLAIQYVKWIAICISIGAEVVANSGRLIHFLGLILMQAYQKNSIMNMHIQ